MSHRGNFEDEQRTDLQTKGREIPEAYELEVVGGPSTASQFRVHRNAAGRLFVGSSSASDWVLEDRNVSRRHLSLECELGGLRVIDMGSTNGTYVNGLLVSSALVHGGETLAIGGSTIRVRGMKLQGEVAIPNETAFGRVLGSSLEMRRLYPLFQRLASNEAGVLVEGEAGTGKELLAETLHEASARRAAPFEVLDCNAAQGPRGEELLFGKQAGSNIDRGALERVGSGTLVLKEVSELDASLWAPLARAIERREFRRVGGGDLVPLGARVFATTRQNLEELIQTKRFSDALFYQLAVGRVELPPLRKRTGDIPFLAAHLWTRLGGAGDLPAELSRKLQAHAWPGNVRELRHTIARSMATGDVSLAFEEEVARINPESFASVLKLDLPITRARQIVVEAFERQYVADILRKHQGNVTHAAIASGLALRYFQTLRAKRK